MTFPSALPGLSRTSPRRERFLLALSLSCWLAGGNGCYQDAPPPAPPATADMLVTLLGDREAAVRLTAAEALGKIGDPRTGRFLMQALHDSDPRVREAAARSVGVLSEESEEMETELVTLLSDPEVPVRHAAAQALGGRKGTPALMSALTDLLRNPDPTVRQASAHALLLIDGQDILPALSTSVMDDDQMVRQWAVAALGETGDPRVGPVLLDRLRHDPAAGVRVEAAYRLRYVGDASITSALDTIVERDDSPDVKRWAGKVR